VRNLLGATALSIASVFGSPQASAAPVANPTPINSFNNINGDKITLGFDSYSLTERILNG
jgi:hypothetical protein